jgi:predicted ATP-dependent endonuclease of OLD family
VRLVRFKIDGFKRLCDAGTHVAGKMTAFVGPNEAGKSSILEALATIDASDPIPLTKRSRSITQLADDHVVVLAEFTLNSVDVDVLGSMHLSTLPERLILSRRADGTRSVSLYPKPERDPAVREAFAKRAESFEAWAYKQAAQFTSEDGSESPWREVASLVNGAITTTFDDGSPEEDTFTWDGILAALKTAQTEGFSRAEVTTEALLAWRDELSWGDPHTQSLEALAPRIPSFRFFDERHRNLQAEYVITDPALWEDMPPALGNLLNLAQVDPQVLSAALSDPSRRESLLNRANQRLRTIFDRYWTQSELTVLLKFDGGVLRIMVGEHQSGAHVAFNERSDGLRLFVALIAFLGTEGVVPPVLLVDEAETHLHYDAQADLVETLMDQEVASQVLYTTHSPGCLPRDLGVGIRFVSPIGDERSVIRHDFWSLGAQATDLGFSPLLFSMGAGAAAFSSVRRAVIAEGPSDMILLPSLIRLATGEDTLPYQVAPGISVSSPNDYPMLDSVAGRVCYLVDGDTGGATLRQSLVDSGVEPSHVLELPPTLALEDVLDLDVYVRAVNEAIARTGTTKRISVGDLATHPIKKAMSDWCEAQGLQTPSAVVVADILISPESGLALDETHKGVLVDLHTQFTELLGTAPNQTA